MVNKKVLLDQDHKPAHTSSHTIWSSDNCKVSKELKEVKKVAKTKRKSSRVNTVVNVLTEKLENPKERSHV